MRRRRLKKLIRRLRELQQQDLTRDELLLKLGAAKKEAGKAYTLLVIHTPTKDQPVHIRNIPLHAGRKKLRQARRREGTICCAPISRAMILAICGGSICNCRGRASVQGVEDDLSIRPIYHQHDTRIEAIFHCVSCLLSAGHAETG